MQAFLLCFFLRIVALVLSAEDAPYILGEKAARRIKLRASFVETGRLEA